MVEVYCGGQGVGVVGFKGWGGLGVVEVWWWGQGVVGV